MMFVLEVLCLESCQKHGEDANVFTSFIPVLTALYAVSMTIYAHLMFWPKR